MLHVRNPYELLINDVYVDLADILGIPVLLKCESFNFAGSVKLKAAVSMVTSAERDGRLKPGSIIVESSSGNLGVALSIVAASKGYGFICVTDSRVSPQNRKQIEATGGRVVVVSQLDANDGFLANRIRLVREMCAGDDRCVWLNQYANPDNSGAHYRLTAPAIVEHCPDLDYLFIGAGTTGTLMGCARYLRDTGYPARVIAVDSAGSVTFGGAPGPRYVPGLGTSRRPELVDPSVVDDVVLVDERDTILMCRRLAHAGFLFGGSTGTVLAGAQAFLRGRESSAGTSGTSRTSGTSVAISADLGDRYLDTVYDDVWVAEHYGAELLDSCLPTASAAI